MKKEPRFSFLFTGRKQGSIAYGVLSRALTSRGEAGSDEVGERASKNVRHEELSGGDEGKASRSVAEDRHPKEGKLGGFHGNLGRHSPVHSARTRLLICTGPAVVVILLLSLCPPFLPDRIAVLGARLQGRRRRRRYDLIRYDLIRVVGVGSEFDEGHGSAPLRR